MINVTPAVSPTNQQLACPTTVHRHYDRKPHKPDNHIPILHPGELKRFMRSAPAAAVAELAITAFAGLGPNGSQTPN